ncbi:tyrosine-type recombinase/integrase [Pseudoxanthomonas winnipegensis]|uniref:Integrase n=1 Tax=Pseudoxanthomonas winnipegensis TaxID=2480810 RepID=A0A4Q8LFP6_9GAMM|nr:tyrosine-type recombinase/integrase [Pseudoxanthomonas winnipegensis]RZZ81077.1 integrase [Pseudoxanthomonas winnipegensis]TAA27703.1 integrase [Pseudoxanthomonas winnipegensis]TAA42039.1 integrase [Pseudoxanthomonas winnipegensis]TBV70655.1 integrase [Pseudoxanthomonas winnipegensis]
MGRKPSKPGAIPHFRARLRGKKIYYFYDHGGTPRREEPLGSDYGLAIQKWAVLQRDARSPASAQIMFSWVCDQYMSSVAPTKAARTFEDNRKEVLKLKEYFNDPPAPLDAIQPVNVRGYLTWRTAGGKAFVRANREKALLSHIWNFARDRGYTALPNPCAGIKGFRETGRDAYIEDSQYEAIWAAADDCLRDAMDLAYLTGQRPADVLGVSETDIRDGAIHFMQRKTGNKLRVELSGSLEALLERIRARKKAFTVYSTRLIVNEKGRTVGVNAMSRRWAKACALAKVEGIQFRDLRAKAGTDKTESAGDIRKAQEQLGHSSVVMTETYVRKRRGSKVTPTR